MLSNCHPPACACAVPLSCKPWQVLSFPGSPAAGPAPWEASLCWDSGGAVVGCTRGLGFARLLADACGMRASVSLQWDFSYPRTPCGPPRTPETPNPQAWGPPRNQGPAPPAGCRQAPAASVAQRLPAHWLLRLHQDPADSLRSHPGPRGAPPPPGLLSWRCPCSPHRDWAPTLAVSILHAVGKNTDAGEGGGVLPMDSVKNMGSWAQAGAAWWPWLWVLPVVQGRPIPKV